jgi:hypothetical protein
MRWVRVPTRPTPSILTAATSASGVADAIQPTPARMMRRIDLMFAAVVGVAAVAAYVAYPYLKHSAAIEPPDVALSVPQPVATPPSAIAVAPQPRFEPTPEAIAARVATSAPSPSAKLDSVPPRETAAAKAHDAAVRRVADRPAPQPARPPYAVSTAFGGDATAAVPPPVRVAAAPPNAPARKDRLQQLNDTMADCAKEGFFGKIACEQRAVLAYCDGQWGRNDRCPTGRTADYGQ